MSKQRKTVTNRTPKLPFQFEEKLPRSAARVPSEKKDSRGSLIKCRRDVSLMQLEGRESARIAATMYLNPTGILEYYVHARTLARSTRTRANGARNSKKRDRDVCVHTHCSANRSLFNACSQPFMHTPIHTSLRLTLKTFYRESMWTWLWSGVCTAQPPRQRLLRHISIRGNLRSAFYLRRRMTVVKSDNSNEHGGN